MADEMPITKAGKDKIEEELNHLIKVEREKLKETIAEARDLGDLKENAEYHAAKERQAIVEGRIAQLQGILARARVVDVSKISSAKIVFGATVTLRDVEKDTTLVYQVVGEDEADIRIGKVSFNSPLGRALIGKEAGDTVIVKAPKGDVEYEVDNFEFN
jgi:transcription elongation factor GreA